MFATRTSHPRFLKIAALVLFVLALGFTVLHADEVDGGQNGTVLPPAPTSDAVGLESFHPIVHNAPTFTPVP